jgi:SufS family cysteine desulfurase
MPTSLAGLPSHAPGSSEPTPPSATEPDLENFGLTGGFPSSSPSGPPPVHPTVLPAERTEDAPRDGTESGTHRHGDDDSYEFGEPRFYQEPFKANTSGLRAPLAADEDQQLYFLRGLRHAGAPSIFEVRPPSLQPALSIFDVEAVRRDFPALHQRVNGRPLIWLDNAATTHKPQSVLDATTRFYGRDNSNIHRAAHTLSERSTKAFEAGREKVRQFLGAADKNEIVFLRGTTEAINLVAQSYGRQNIGAGDEIILTELEHHANIVPWQILAGQVGATIRVIPINDRGELILEEFVKILGPRTKFVSLAHVSNALGTVNPIEEIIALAHARGVPVLVDGAQSTPHLPVNVTALDADFFVFSAHKIFGPTGIGALYGKAHLLEKMPPYQGGGHMIEDVRFDKTIYRHAPEKFEAGTPDIAGVIGLGAAIDYLTTLGVPAIAAYEHGLLEYATQALGTVPGLRPIGTATNKASVLSFVIPGVPNEVIARHLDQHGIAVRAGHHCALPAQRHFSLETTVRPSLAFYNTYEEIDTLVSVLHQLPKY